MFENLKEYLVVYMVGNSYEYHWCNTEEEMNEFIKGRKEILYERN